jgi:[acyl-carrier-protein] S-malonyltransferase
MLDVPPFPLQSFFAAWNRVYYGLFMSKTALLFAGQGAQVVGMGKDLAEKFPAAKAWFDRANAALGYDLASICFNGPEAELTKTENAQPGIFLVSWVCFELLKERVHSLKSAVYGQNTAGATGDCGHGTLDFQATAGLSLGEFTALTAAGAMRFEDGLRVVRQRGKFMQEACDATRGGMAAVIGLDEARTREVCAEAGVVLANLNCPGQIVISGEAEKITKACELAKAGGAKRAIPLPVVGAYHSPLMAGAQPKLQAELAKVKLSPPSAMVISNVTGQPHGDPGQIQTRLVEQVTSSVRWEESMRYLLVQGFTRFIELGPGAALSGFMKRIDKDAQMLNVADVTSLEATVTALTRGALKSDASA